jgi:hypothetical protein
LAVVNACWNNRSRCGPSAPAAFAEHQRIQARGDAEQVPHRLRVLVPIEVGVEVAGIGMAREPVGERVARVVRQRVELGAVAGGEQRDFANGRHAPQLRQRARHRVAAERNAFAQPDRRGLVVDAEDDEAHGVASTRVESRLR